MGEEITYDVTMTYDRARKEGKLMPARTFPKVDGLYVVFYREACAEEALLLYLVGDRWSHGIPSSTPTAHLWAEDNARYGNFVESSACIEWVKNEPELLD